MSDHINGWLHAFHDGELGRRRSEKVRAHLEDCEACREELEKLSSLRLLLQENPEASDLMPLDQFVAQVGLRLPHRAPRSAFQRSLLALWTMIPVILLGVWAFAQALVTVARALDIGLWSELVQGFSFTSQSNLVGVISLQFGFMIVTGLISLSWLASWWIKQQGNPLQRATE